MPHCAGQTTTIYIHHIFVNLNKGNEAMTDMYICHALWKFYDRGSPDVTILEDIGKRIINSLRPSDAYMRR